MDADQLKQLQDKNIQKFPKVLEQFNKENANLFKFDKFHKNDLWITLWKTVFNILNDERLEEHHILCLNTIRILSRDEASLMKNNIVDDIGCLLKMAHLTMSSSLVGEPSQEQESPRSVSSLDILVDFNMERVVEALKCLCNLVFQNAEIRRDCVRQNVADQIFHRLSSTLQVPEKIELFDMKLLFLITALETSVRSRVLFELNGLTYMTELMDEKLRSTKEFSDGQLDVIIEMLKVMFNITSCTDKSPSENEIQSLHLTSVIRDLLLRFGAMSNERERQVVSHSIDLLTNISSSCLSELMLKVDGPSSSSASMENCRIFENRNVTALDIILNFLLYALDDLEKNTSSNKEHVQPVLTILVKCVCSNSTMRHYVRSIVLPPLRDVYKRPEEGNELRNYLCRLLMNPNMVVRNLSYELLLVCCKKNPSRLIKHFGYGNMAGLFANAGILDCRKPDTSEYSSDSEDSDTEEYKRIKHSVNPVLGCYMPPTTNPLDGMSDEQKEYEAEKLAQLVDKLHRGGIIKPCRINEEGKPEPVDHILQLQQELPQQQVQQKGKD
ncbi:synembryn-like [Lucilia sericata]|uniref:synembryn-like n=1 Tax=Lucilia sericata TaxID=13632 RepID=UPI0018A80C7B|nr:synembryn-like [Lucilia sericata]